MYRSVSMEYGAGSVMIPGILMMLLLYVGN